MSPVTRLSNSLDLSSISEALVPLRQSIPLSKQRSTTLIAPQRRRQRRQRLPGPPSIGTQLLLDLLPMDSSEDTEMAPAQLLSFRADNALQIVEYKPVHQPEPSTSPSIPLSDIRAVERIIDSAATLSAAPTAISSNLAVIGPAVLSETPVIQARTISVEEAVDDLRLASFTANSSTIESQQAATKTAATYKPYQTRYFVFWDAHQTSAQQENPNHPYIPALPITATKVYFFVKHERTRKKRKRNGSGEYEEGTNVGRSAIIGTITALESLRRQTAHLYTNDAEAQKPLRDDFRIQTEESDAKKDEPARVAHSQQVKAAGSSAGTYVLSQVTAMSRWCLTSAKTTQRSAASLIRDRAMFLLSAATAFRGDSSRQVQLSDLFLLDIPFPELGQGAIVKAVMILADNAKHNSNGRVDETGMIRHAEVELCPIGGLALHLFAMYHFKSEIVNERREFSPDFSDAAKEEGYGQFGKRSWYAFKLFPGGDSPSDEMSYTNHNERVKKMQFENGVRVKSVTHATRGYAATTSRQFRATENEVKILGGWNIGEGSYRACYERAPPLGAMLGAANFNAQRPGDYRIPRSSLVPPKGLAEEIFSFAEVELAALDDREKQDLNALDISARKFLELLIYLRLILLQDLALLHVHFPRSPVFSIAPFNSPAFLEFAAGALEQVSNANAKAQQAMDEVPEHLAIGFRNAMNTLAVAQASGADSNGQRLDHLESLVVGLAQSISEANLTRSFDKATGAQKRARTQAPPMPSCSLRPQAQPSHIPPAPTVRTMPAASTVTYLASTPTDPPSPSITINVSVSTSGSSAAVHNSPSPASRPRNNAEAPSLSFGPTTVAPAATLTPGPPPTQETITDQQLCSWTKITQKYAPEIIKSHEPWDWISGSWTPTYEPFIRKRGVAVGLAEVWGEYSSGIPGYIGTQQLTQDWQAHWKRGTHKSEWTRRNKIVSVIEAIARCRPNWTPEVALRFLKAEYSPYYGSARSFTDALSGKTQALTSDAILANAIHWKM